jgi:hypothetical protein
VLAGVCHEGLDEIVKYTLLELAFVVFEASLHAPSSATQKTVKAAASLAHLVLPTQDRDSVEQTFVLHQ